jgi:CTP synthase
MVKALEQFICPPLERSLLTGDVVREIARDDNTAQTFRVIVTPSCDLVTGDNRNPVSDVLVARCIPVNDAEVIRKCGLLNAKPTTLPEKLGKRLKKDELSNMCVLPAFYDFWPAMVVDLRKLDLIPRSEIALKKDECGISTRFYRVASLDSPFRERLSWRYVETAGRPGIPDLDQEGLEQDVVNAARPQIGG